jgi:hypothetical protein
MFAKNKKARQKLRRASFPIPVSVRSEHRPPHVGTMMPVVMNGGGECHKPVV